jgi:hypothetical protein
MLQGAAADCNSAEATHAWFDSKIAHHLPDIFLQHCFAAQMMPSAKVFGPE